ncbi:hypothetical protein LguiA_018004 [Lonicera macranthoides]
MLISLLGVHRFIDTVTRTTIRSVGMGWDWKHDDNISRLWQHQCFFITRTLDMVTGAPPGILSHHIAEPKRLSPVNSSGSAKKPSRFSKTALEGHRK